MQIKITPIIATDLARFKKDLGYDCNINAPATHNEHIMHKKYTDRNPLLTVTADKIRCRNYVAERLKKSGITDALTPIPVLYAGYDPNIAAARVEKNCVVKMNNASGRNIFIFNKFDRASIYRRLRDWMRRPYTNGIGEEKTIAIERAIRHEKPTPTERATEKEKTIGNERANMKKKPNPSERA